MLMKKNNVFFFGFILIINSIIKTSILLLKISKAIIHIFLNVKISSQTKLLKKSNENNTIITIYMTIINNC
jgi:hypothetical protein